MSPLHQEVRDDWVAFNEPDEGYIDHMYLDTHKLRGISDPLVTCAVGILIDPLNSYVTDMPWLTVTGDSASAQEIEDEWSRVKAMTGGKIAKYYVSPTGLHLDADGIALVVLRRLDDDVTTFVHGFPEFASWPAQAQKAACSMMWAMGAYFYTTWPKWSAAALKQDWATCAKECIIPDVGNPGLDPRNKDNVALFLQAATGG